jgi:hypothetical protein
MSRNLRSALTCITIVCVFAAVVTVATMAHDCAGCGERQPQPQPVAHAHE